MVQLWKKNTNCIGKSGVFIYLAVSKLSCPAEEVKIPQVKISAEANPPVIRILQNIKHVIQE